MCVESGEVEEGRGRWGWGGGGGGGGGGGRGVCGGWLATKAGRGGNKMIANGERRAFVSICNYPYHFFFLADKKTMFEVEEGRVGWWFFLNGEASI